MRAGIIHAAGERAAPRRAALAVVNNRSLVKDNHELRHYKWSSRAVHYQKQLLRRRYGAGFKSYRVAPK